MVDNSQINHRPPEMIFKSRLYVNNPHYLQEMKDTIRNEITTTSTQVHSHGSSISSDV
jgi:hypothetical protein